MSTGGARSTLVAAYALALDRFSAAASSMPQDASPIAGDRSLREILIRLAAWHEEGAARLPALVAGADDREDEVEAFDAAAVTAAREEDVAAAWQRYGHAVRAFAGALAAAPDEAFSRGGPAARWVAAQSERLRADTEAIRRAARR